MSISCIPDIKKYQQHEAETREKLVHSKSTFKKNLHLFLRTGWSLLSASWTGMSILLITVREYI